MWRLGISLASPRFSLALLRSCHGNGNGMVSMVMKMMMSTQAEYRKIAQWASNLKIEDLPVQTFETRFSRSSGPGGQNVNKVNTKVDLRFQVAKASWIPEYVRQRLFDQEKGRINKAGEFVIVSETHRTQQQNLQECLAKLHEMIMRAAEVPGETSEETRQRVGRHQAKEREERTNEKKARASTKSQRTKQHFGNDD